MSMLRESAGPRVSWRSARRRLALLAAAAVLASGCGSGVEQSSPVALDDTETAAVATGALENAVASGAVCKDWPAGTTLVTCAVGAMGPGGGRVFFDAGSAQSWGRYLEVAPQAWGGTLYNCSSCGSVPDVVKKTSDNGGKTTGYYPCRTDSSAVLLPGEAGDTLWEIGGGRRNTEVLSNTAECVDGTTSALTLATGYRGGGLSDWYLPSGGELTELCRYSGRDAIGGFSAHLYASSTVGPQEGDTNFYQVNFKGNPLCERVDSIASDTVTTGRVWVAAYVRPIRAFA